MDTDLIIQQTRNWVEKVVIGLNFCPFAAWPFKAGTIHYEVLQVKEPMRVLKAVAAAVQQLDTNKNIETTLVILPQGFDSFSNYLGILKQAEAWLKKEGYRGVYQIASFHPEYRFGEATDNDPANYTNRSPYPMLHLLREASLTKALKNYPHPEEIPERNMQLAREKGEAAMREMRNDCMLS